MSLIKINIDGRQVSVQECPPDFKSLRKTIEGIEKSVPSLKRHFGAKRVTVMTEVDNVVHIVGAWQ